MSTGTLLFWYVALLLGGLAGVAFYYELRQRRFRPNRTRDNVFRCVKCSFVYTDDADVDRSRCPNCGETNEACEF